MYKLILIATSSLAMTACTYSSHGPEDNRSVESAGIIASRHVDVTGDAEFSGVRVNARGEIGRDLDLAGASVRSNASVGGDLTAAGASVVFTGSVAGNSDIAGARVNLDAEFDGDVEIAGARVKFDGVVHGRLEAHTVRINLKGDFLGPVLLIGEGREGRSGHALISGYLAQGGIICASEVEFKRQSSFDGELTIISDERPSEAPASFTYIELDGRDCDRLDL